MGAIPLDSSIRRILVVNFGGIGDEILFFPTIRTLAETYPDAAIDAVVEPRCVGVMKFNPHVREVFPFDAKHEPKVTDFLKLVLALRRRRYDLAVTAGSSPAMAALVFLAGASHRVGYATHRLTALLSLAVPLNKRQYAGGMYHDLVAFTGRAAQLPEMRVPEADRGWAKGFLAEHGVAPDRPVVVFHPGVSKLSIEKKIIKGWAPERWVELGRRLAADGAQLVLAGGPDDEDVIRLIRETGDFPAVEAFGKTKGMGQLAALMAEADAVVAVDSAPMHVGVAVGTPTIGIFGPTDPAKLLPATGGHRAVHVEGLACRPCLWDHRQTSCDALTCLQDLTVERVHQAVRETLGAPRPS